MLENSTEIGVYRILNTITRRVYIGRTANSFKIRCAQHRMNLQANKHISQLMQQDFNEFGIESFMFEIIHICDEDASFSFEKDYINKRKPEYNTKKSIKYIPGTGVTWAELDEIMKR